MSTVWFKVNAAGKEHFSLWPARSCCILPPSSQDFMRRGDMRQVSPGESTGEHRCVLLGGRVTDLARLDIKFIVPSWRDHPGPGGGGGRGVVK